MRFVFVAAIAVSLSVGMVGCGGPSEPAQPNPTSDASLPPPPTPEELAKRVIKDLGLEEPLPAPGARIPASVKGTTLGQFEQQRNTLSKTPEGKAALEIVKARLHDRINALYNAQMWEHVLLYTDAFARLDPQIKKYDDMRAEATIQLRKPRVTVHGLPQVDGHQLAVLSIYVPLDGKTYDERLSVGEEMHGIKFLDVYGANRGITYEYLETGDKYIALMDAAK